MTTTTKATSSTPLTKRVHAIARDAQAGDLIFVRPAPDDRIGQMIADATDGLYCHVRVRLSKTEVIEAVSWQGVQRNPLAGEPRASDVAHVGVAIDRARFLRARGWLVKRVGAKYSGWDILADIVKAVLPSWLGVKTPFLVMPSRYDCSELACRFLIHAGCERLPDDLIDDPQRCSPNDLARALGVLK